MVNYEALSKAFLDVGPSNAARTLFCLATWNPNRSAELRLQYALAVLGSLKFEAFNACPRSFDYNQFRELAQKTIGGMPTFGFLEDYVPEGDWGEVKFFFESRTWKIPYGCSLSWSYDFLTAFNLIYCKYADQLAALTNENPIAHLRETLVFLDDLLSRISNPKESGQIDPGHLEVPSEKAWRECNVFVDTFQKFLSDSYLRTFSIELGAIDRELLFDGEFANNLFSSAFDFIFLKVGDQYFPTIPRRAYPVLIEHWNTLSDKFKGQLQKNKTSIGIDIGTGIGKFIRDRIKKNSFYHLVGVGKFKEVPDSFVFPFAILSKKRLFLFAFTSPFSKKSVEDQLAQIEADLLRLKPVFAAEWAIYSYLDYGQTLIRDREGKLPEPTFVVIVPNKSANGTSFQIPENLDAEVWSLEQFLGVIDEVDDADDLSDFIEYQKNLSKVTLAALGTIDLFSSFKDSDQTLIEGAIEPSFISLDPHWGSFKRFKTLSEFWSAMPPYVLEGDPRQWKIHDKGHARVRLISRNHFGFAYAMVIASSTVTLTGPIDRMQKLDVLVLDMMAQVLTDMLIDYRDALSRHKFFHQCRQLTIAFIPKFLRDDPDFSHLRDVQIGREGLWNIEAGRYSTSEWGVRIIFDLEKVRIRQASANNRSFDVELFTEMLQRLDEVIPDKEAAAEIISTASEDAVKKARYTIIEKTKTAAFPDFSDSAKPCDRHFKRARNKIAHITKTKGIIPGVYSLKSANQILNELVSDIYKHILEEVSKFDFEKSIGFLVSKIDSLTHHHEVDALNITEIEGREIHFDPSQVTAEQKEKFQYMHRNYRFIIECFALIRPSDHVPIDKESFSNLAALVDWFFVFRGASDQIHFNVTPTSLEITSDFLVNIDYLESTKKNMDEYGKELAQKLLDWAGSQQDRVTSPRPVEDFLESVDRAFHSDLGFGIKDLVNILQVMALWPSYSKPESEIHEEEAEYYEATAQEIVKITTNSVTGLTEESAYKVLYFLTLRSENLLKIIGGNDQQMLPVGEHYKRHSRYTIRPLLETKAGILWGAHSAQKAAQIWGNSPPQGKLPIDLCSTRIATVLAEEKKLIEDELVVRAKEIALRHTPLAESDVRLHRRDKTGGHPVELGDYDLICFLKDKNILLLGECKHLLQVRSMKDARDLREDIFGTDDELGYIHKINRRDEYVKSQWQKVFSTLGWPQPTSAPQIVSLYISVHSYWWTRFPPIDTTVRFLQIDDLNQFFRNLY